MKVLVFDLEIKKAILSRGESPEDGILYCEGWHDHKSMGISVLGAFDFASNRTRVFCDDNRYEMMKDYFGQGYLFAGFNSKRFDAKVIEAAWQMKISDDNHYDILEEMWRAHGLDPDNFNWRTHGGFGLDATIKANFPSIEGKTGNGAQAPADWQRGNIGLVVDYCLQDVMLTRMLLEQIAAEGGLISPKSKVLIALPDPFAKFTKTLAHDEAES